MMMMMMMATNRLERSPFQHTHALTYGHLASRDPAAPNQQQQDHQALLKTKYCLRVAEETVINGRRRGKEKGEGKEQGGEGR